ncbi:hypothetical protein [Streptomyces sp. C10-9-1]|uniref:hypothetical protein n=1 Tax=Streptomyces sp. C10-9-1 TaxID=1859285 RepID=UPI0027E56B87|nr:hypothetical protein [Streptomyces sp. C10-9-1]
MRAWRTVAAAGACAVGLAGTAACQPVGGGLNSAAVAVTTDRTATSTLERLTFEVAWFSCRAQAPTPAPGSTATGAPAAATVDCEGETESGQEITLDGTVTEERAGVCVRGDMTARIAGETVFEATMLGDCSAAATASPEPSRQPGDRPVPGATVTVTRTVTVTAEPAK